MEQGQAAPLQTPAQPPQWTGQGRDSEGISKPTLIQLILYSKIGCIRVSLEIPLLYLGQGNLLDFSQSCNFRNLWAKVSKFYILLKLNVWLVLGIVVAPWTVMVQTQPKPSLTPLSGPENFIFWKIYKYSQMNYSKSLKESFILIYISECGCSDTV